MKKQMKVVYTYNEPSADLIVEAKTYKEIKEYYGRDYLFVKCYGQKPDVVLS